MQDLLLAQKRDRPAYCFQHLDLELRPNVDSSGENGQTSAPGPAVLARFCAEWNSLEVNKTRSVNILSGVQVASCTVLLQFDDNRLKERSRGVKPPGRAARTRSRSQPDRPRTERGRDRANS